MMAVGWPWVTCQKKKKSLTGSYRGKRKKCVEEGQTPRIQEHMPDSYTSLVPQSCPCHLMTRRRGTRVPQENYGKSISFSLRGTLLPAWQHQGAVINYWSMATAHKSGGENKREMVAKSLRRAHSLKLASTRVKGPQGYPHLEGWRGKPQSSDFPLRSSPVPCPG